ncbi:hypothetical protein AKO1_015361 [Acrasis kona]|uniref:C2 NT-type domain-containing protein n=1 Tax=Acrasis kona TaxID=1008807 RepID=A0AAW2ZFT4_9EUKA
MLRNFINNSIKKIQERHPARIIDFDCHITLESLEEVPIQGHSFYVTWKFRQPQFQPSLCEGGQTSMQPILKSHRVDWREPLGIMLKSKHLPSTTFSTAQPFVCLRVNNKTNTLIDCYIDFKVYYRQTPQARSSVCLGAASINLSVYALDNKRSVHSFLLKNSALNSTLKVSVLLKQMSGDRLYKCPTDVHKQRNELSEQGDSSIAEDTVQTLDIADIYTAMNGVSRRRNSNDSYTDSDSTTSVFTDACTNNSTANVTVKTPSSPDGVMLSKSKYGIYTDESDHFSVNNDEVVNSIINIYKETNDNEQISTLEQNDTLTMRGPGRSASFDDYVEGDHSGLIDSIIRRNFTKDEESEDEYGSFKMSTLNSVS